MHGLYWHVVNLATRRPILLAVHNPHWGDDASFRWLAYLAARLDGIEASLVVSLRPHEPRSQGRPLQAVRDPILGNPGTKGWIAEIAYIPFISSPAPGWPWFNARIGLQYTWYNEFAGTTIGASANNTLFLYVWVAM